jgi:hypothetical protein
LKTRRSRAVLLFLFFVDLLCIRAQVDQAFLRYLSDQGFKREHKAYLSSLSCSADSLLYLEAKFDLQYFNDSAFYRSYISGKSLFDKDSNALALASVIYLKSKAERQSLWFNAINADGSSARVKTLGQVYRMSLDPLNADVKQLPEKLLPSFKKYRKAYGKNPVAAATLSALVPGLGKLYIGRKKSFLITLLSNAVYGVQSYESLHKFGIKNSFSILNLGFFSVFYLANIYGSYKDTKQVKKETRTQFLINASDYYHIEYSPQLY